MSETSAENQTERLIVKNFGPLKDVDIELKDIMVFIGPQASGKSTLAKILYNIYSFPIILNKEKFKIQFEQTNINFFTGNTVIEYTIRGKGFISYSKNEFKLHNILDNISEKYKNSSLIEQFKIFEQYIKENKEQNINLKKGVTLKKIIQEIEQIKLAIQKITSFIPAERSIISNLSNSIMGVLADGVSIPKFILEFGRRFEIARNELKKIHIDFLNVTYKYSFDAGNRIFLSPKKSISLSEAASGIQSVVPLYLVTKHFAESDLLIIEEPELNLFPETQKKLVEFIIETCRDKTKRLIITTHSPYILTVLNNLIQAHNVVKERPELEEEVNKIIPKERWLDFDKVGVYYVADGTAKNIMHEKNRIIKAENLDSVSKNLSNEFGQLLDLQYGD